MAPKMDFTVLGYSAFVNFLLANKIVPDKFEFHYLFMYVSKSQRTFNNVDGYTSSIQLLMKYKNLL